ncbi:hypothetical protein SDC9_201325 [bioreactor metagenome]|uniref:Uncharacterized protein n=1 Tax=bioreactor metagenome TaxID=1076179 RepID=A0A645IQN4_9ZZZZ
MVLILAVNIHFQVLDIQEILCGFGHPSEQRCFPLLFPSVFIVYTLEALDKNKSIIYIMFMSRLSELTQNDCDAITSFLRRKERLRKPNNNDFKPEYLLSNQSNVHLFHMSWTNEDLLASLEPQLFY